jgi:ribosomal protein S18 acetylase RimI-like enzyme
LPPLERVVVEEEEVVRYLEADLVRNALDIWNLKTKETRCELYVIRDADKIVGHLSIYHTPEADYVSASGKDEATIAEVLGLFPEKCVATVGASLYGPIEKVRKPTAVYQNDLMLVRRGEEKLSSPELAVRLSVGDAPAYARFGTSFNVPEVPIEWVRERLEKDVIFGMFAGGELVSVASVAARLPSISALMGVETKEKFRGRGYGTIATSAATREALRLSESCMLFVRSDNLAVRMYQKLGFKKVGEELWIDIGTGLVP